jgi:hypothetical protein
MEYSTNKNATTNLSLIQWIQTYKSSAPHQEQSIYVQQLGFLNA